MPPASDRGGYWNEAVEAFFDSLDRLHIDRERFAQEIPIRIRFTQEEIAAFRAYLARQAGLRGIFRRSAERGPDRPAAGLFHLDPDDLGRRIFQRLWNA